MNKKDIGSAVLEILEVIKENSKFSTELPDLGGKCNCSYKGKFSYIGSFLDEKNKYAFSIYLCPECHTSLSGEVLLNNKYGSNITYKMVRDNETR